MSSSVGLLDFFILEASDYVERLDALLASAASTGPEPEAFNRYARALRGSATMSRLSGIAEVAAGVERVGRALQQGATEWTPSLQGVLVAAIDDLKILIRGVRTWGGPEEQRARARAAELAAAVPDVARRHSATPTNTGPTGTMFLASATAEIAAGLEAYATRPVAREVISAALERVRALRGVAALRDLPPLPDVLDSLERAAKPLELGGRAPAPSDLALFGAAAALLRRASSEIRGGGRPDVNAPEIQRFRDAAGAMTDTAADADRIVPIAELFFADGGPHVVQRASHPPTTPSERFRLEVVSQAEHLRRLVGEAREARDPATRDRLSRELRSALRALANAAEGFGEQQIAQHVNASRDAIASLDTASLSGLDSVASLLANPATTQEALLASLDRLATRRQGGVPTPPVPVATTRAAPVPPLDRPTAVPAASPPIIGDFLTRSGGTPPEAPSVTMAPSLQDTKVVPARGAAVGAAGADARDRMATPTGKALHALLESGIAGISRLDQAPLSEPTPYVDDTVVPIGDLLYRGRAALRRAIELRDELRAAPGAPNETALAELFDLLELAAAD